MCTTGRTPGSSSRVATRRISCGWPSRSATVCDPQMEQKWRRLPGDASNDETLATFEPPETIAIDRGGRGEGGDVGLPARTAVAMSNRPIQLIDFVLHRSTNTASLHGVRSTLA